MKAFIKEIGFMLVLSSFCALLIGTVNLTVGNGADISLPAAKTILAFSGIAEKADDQNLLESFFKQFKKLVLDGSNSVVWQSQKNPEFMAMEKSGSGMWGKITVLVIFNLEKSQIIAVRVLKQNETPGLGSRIEESEFYEQFTEMQTNKVKLISNPAEVGEFDGISGATISSKAVERIINSAIQNIEAVARQSALAGGEHT